MSQALSGFKDEHPRLLVNVCGCLALLGITFSTVLAQSDGGVSPLLASLPLGVPAVPTGRRRQRRLESREARTPQERAASYARYSSELQREESLADQQRRCREAAERNGQNILPDLEFADASVSGTKRNREGLNALIHSAECGEFNVLYVYSLSRLARESIITMPLLKKLVHTHHIRFISITEGIDTARAGWELSAAVVAIIHEQYIKELGANVLRGQEGNLLEDYSVGDWCFGYCSEAVSGTERTRRGRDARPRMRYLIDPETSTWVRQIFCWFVEERRSIRWIVRELNRLKAPKDHRSTTADWDHPLVAGLLQNRKYIGIWTWGENRNVRDPETGDIHQEPRPDDECAQWIRHRPHLQIIENDLFFRAQEYLQENIVKYSTHRRSNGQFRGSSSGTRFGNPTYLVSGLFECAECHKRLLVAGTGSKFLFCPGHAKGLCSCKTHLPLQLAENMILDAVGLQVLQNADWTASVWYACQQEWERYQQTVPTEMQEVERKLGDLDRKIERLIDSLEDGENSGEISTRLKERRAEKVILVACLEKLRATDSQQRAAPTEAWLKEQLSRLGETLKSRTPAAAHALKNLVGRKIVVERVQRPGRASCFWRGTLSLKVHAVCQALGVTAVEIDQDGGKTDETIVLDFCRPDGNAELMQRIRQMYDDGKLGVEIGRELGLHKSRVTLLLKRSFGEEGKSMPDGRKRRHELATPTSELTTAERLSQAAKDLWDQHMPIQEIAHRLEVGRSVITQAVNFWFQTRGLPKVDGRKRRREIRLLQQSRNNRAGDELGTTTQEDMTVR